VCSSQPGFVDLVWFSQYRADPLRTAAPRSERVGAVVLAFASGAPSPGERELAQRLAAIGQICGAGRPSSGVLGALRALGFGCDDGVRNRLAPRCSQYCGDCGRVSWWRRSPCGWMDLIPSVGRRVLLSANPRSLWIQACVCVQKWSFFYSLFWKCGVAVIHRWQLQCAPNLYTGEVFSVYKCCENAVFVYPTITTCVQCSILPCGHRVFKI